MVGLASDVKTVRTRDSADTRKARASEFAVASARMVTDGEGS
jgi:hypothetical protein